jgi:excisionase family DNA binding protein
MHQTTIPSGDPLHPRGRLVGVPEAARVLGVSQQRVRVLIAEGRLPAEKTGTSRFSHWRVRLSDVIEFPRRGCGWRRAHARRGST